MQTSKKTAGARRPIHGARLGDSAIRICAGVALALSALACGSAAEPPPESARRAEQPMMEAPMESGNCSDALGACYVACQNGSASSNCFSRCDAAFFRCLND